MISRNFNVASFLFLIVVPVLNVLWIAQSEHLTGDFRATKISFGFVDFIFFMLFIFGNAIVIAIFSRLRVASAISKKRLDEKLLLILLVLYLIVGLAFGMQGVGGHNKVTNPISLVFAKFSIEWIYFILCGASKKRLTILISSLIIIVISILKTSLFGFLTVAFGLLIHAHARTISPLKIGFSALLVFLIVLSFGNFLIFLYEFRAQLRGVEITIDSTEIISLILGRLSSYSSFYFAMSNVSHLDDVNDIEPFIVFMVVLLKLPFSGMGLSTTEIFNQFIGTSGYSIFLGFPTVVSILLYQSLTGFFIFLLLFSILALLIKCLIPYCHSRNIIFSCLLMPILISGDFWEMLILIEKLLFSVLMLRFLSQLTFGNKR